MINLLPPELTIKESFSESQIQELLEYTKTDSNINKYTHDYQRFESRKTFDDWVTQERQHYILEDKTGALLGLIWFEPFTMPDQQYEQNFNPDNYHVTFAIRLYGSARGKGLAKPFAKTAFNLFYQKSDIYQKYQPTGIWLAVHGENEIAKHLYQSLGFKKVSTDDSWVMVFN